MTKPILFFFFLIAFAIFALVMIFAGIDFPTQLYFWGTDHGSNESFSGYAEFN